MKGRPCVCVRRKRKECVYVCEHVIFESHRKGSSLTTLPSFSFRTSRWWRVFHSRFSLFRFFQSSLWLLLKGIRPLLRHLLLLFETDVCKAISIEYEWRASEAKQRKACEENSQIWYFSPQFLAACCFSASFPSRCLLLLLLVLVSVVRQDLRKLDYREISFEMIGFQNLLHDLHTLCTCTLLSLLFFSFFHFGLLIIRVQKSSWVQEQQNDWQVKQSSFYDRWTGNKKWEEPESFHYTHDTWE